jgi:hypothetical protein
MSTSEYDVEQPKTLQKKLSDDDVSFISSEISSVEEEIVIPLSEMPNKVRFLTSIGLVSFVYSVSSSLAIILILIDNRLAKQWYRSFQLTRTLVPLLLASLALKLCFGLLGFKMRGLASSFFGVDCLLTFVITIGLYFHFEERQRKYYIYQGYYVVVLSFTYMFNQIFFIISTFIQVKKNSNKKPRYNFVIGFVLLCVSTIIGLFFTSQIQAEAEITLNEYMIFFFVLAVWNFYFCHNSYLLIRLRKNKFYQHESIYAYFCYFGDFFFIYWENILKNSRIYRKAKIQKLMQRKDKLKEEKSRKRPR